MNFVDTSAFLALLDEADSHHERAVQCWKKLLLEAHPLLTNNYVLVETIAISQRRLGLEAVQEIQSEILPFLHIEWIDESQHAAIVNRVLTTNRRRVSLVDCSAFETMRARGIETVFTFDEHFRDEGFTVIP